MPSLDILQLMGIEPLRRVAACTLILTIFTPLSGFGWGSDGHRIINRLAATTLPADVPAFLRTDAAASEIEYLGPEPDRWRSRAEPELSAAQAPEHFLDLEPADALGPLPRNRLDFEALVFAHGQRPEKIGLQPWETLEVWQRLKADLREYRRLSADKSANQGDLHAVEQAAIFYAGWLGHYVGDGSQPLHTTINYDGWALKDNPNGYTTAHGIHSRFETQFVSANIKAADVQPKMTEPKAISGDVFDSYVAYLRHTATMIETVYTFDKAGAFENAGTPESRAFTAERIAAGASELRDLIYTAWVESAKPVPERN
jgi:S1/P1 Nuclease